MGSEDTGSRDGETMATPPAADMSKRVGAVLFYFTMAVAMSFVNKEALRLFKFPNTLLLIQMLLSWAGVHMCSMAGFTRVRPLTWQTARATCGVSIFYNANVAFALAALTSLNIPMYQTLKRLTPCIVVAMNMVLRRGRPPWKILAAVGVISLGALLAGMGDFEFDAKAYGMAFTSCVLQATYLILAEATGVEKGFSSAELLLYNSILSSPVLFLIVALTGELQTAGPVLLEKMVSPEFTLLVGSAALMGGLLNYAIFLCTMLNSALTSTIVGVMKAVLTTALGYIFYSLAVTPLNFTGVVVNTLGGCYYSYVKYKAKLERDQEKATAAAGSP